MGVRFHYPQDAGALSLSTLPNPPQGRGAASAPAPTLVYGAPLNGAVNNPVAPRGPTEAADFDTIAAVDTLPTGLSVDPANGVVSGTPTQTTPGPTNYTMRATGPGGTTDAELTINITP